MGSKRTRVRCRENKRTVKKHQKKHQNQSTRAVFESAQVMEEGSSGGEDARGETTPDAAIGAGQADPGGFVKRKSSQFLFTGPRKCPFCARVFASQHAVDIHSYRNAACRARFKVDEAPKDGRSRADSRRSAPSSEELLPKRSTLSQPSHPRFLKKQKMPESPPAPMARTAPANKLPTSALFTTILARYSPALHSISMRHAGGLHTQRMVRVSS